MRVRVPGGHLRKAEAPAETEAEKLLGENKTEKREAFMSLKLLFFRYGLRRVTFFVRGRYVCAKVSLTRAVLCYLYF